MVYYFILSHQNKKFYSIEMMDMVIFHLENGVGGNLNPSNYCGNHCSEIDTLVGFILCWLVTHF